MEIWPGEAFPLGATFDGSGCNFSLFSEVGGRVDTVLRHVVQCLGQELVVAAMGSVHGVCGGQRQNRADRPALLTDRRVRWSVNEPLARQVQYVLLERANEDQLAEH